MYYLKFVDNFGTMDEERDCDLEKWNGHLYQLLRSGKLFINHDVTVKISL